jgi:hypothetical protein
MSQNLISKAYHAAKAVHTGLKDQRTQQKELQALKVRAANSSNPQALEALKEKYGSPIKQLYVKSAFPGGKLYVSRNPPVFGERSAQNAFNLLEMALKKRRAPATQNAASKVIGQAAKGGTDSSETAERANAVRALHQAMNSSTQEARPAQSAHVESSQGQQVASRPADAHDVRVRRTERLNKLQTSFRLLAEHYANKPRNRGIERAIARADDAALNARFNGSSMRFAEALAIFLPTPDGARADISDAAKLDHYLRNSDLSVQLTEKELDKVLDYYLDCWAEHDKTEAAIKAGQST